jgi:hypothetical protein
VTVDSAATTARQDAGGRVSRHPARHKVAVGALVALVGAGYSVFSLTLHYTLHKG